MSRRGISSLAVAVIVAGLWTAITSPGKAETIVDQSVPSSRRDRLIAQLFYPPVSDDPTFRVIGRGRASQPADRAQLQFKFTTNYSFESPPEGTTTALAQFDEEPEPLTKETLQPIVDALVRSGVSADDIEVKIIEPSYSFFSAVEGGAELVVKVEAPTRTSLEEIVDTTTEAGKKIDDILLGSVGVEYGVDDCQALERAAYQSAVEDAQNRASGLAEAMGAQLRKVPSIAEPFYSVFLPGCNSKISLPFATQTAIPYNPDTPVEVEVTKDIFVMFTVK